MAGPAPPVADGMREWNLPAVNAGPRIDKKPRTVNAVDAKRAAVRRCLSQPTRYRPMLSVELLRDIPTDKFQRHQALADGNNLPVIVICDRFGRCSDFPGLPAAVVLV
jgi:hypothetical protein